MKVEESIVWVQASSKKSVCGRNRYAGLDRCLLQLGFKKGSANRNLYQRTNAKAILIVDVFVNDIIFGGYDEMNNKFSKEMKREFEMSMVGTMEFFLALQITQNKNTIFISQTNYHKDLLIKFGM